MSLFQLPYELLSYVVRHLDLHDIRSLSLSSRRLQYLTREANITKRILEVNSLIHSTGISMGGKESPGRLYMPLG